MTAKEIAVATAEQRETWIRLPRTGPEANTGLCRSHLADLVRKAEVRSFSLRRPGTRRGVRLIHLGSVLAYLHEQEAEAKRMAS